MLESITPLLTDPAAWAALVTLVVMEVVLGIDNLTSSRPSTASARAASASAWR